MKKWGVVVAVGAALIVGVIGGMAVERRKAKAAADLYVVVVQSEIAGLCERALSTTESGRTTSTKRAFEHQLSSSIEQAMNHTKTATDLDFPVPSLVEGVRRAHEYALRQGMRDTASRCDVVIAFLRRGFVHT